MNRPVWLTTLGLFALALVTTYFWRRQSYLLVTFILACATFVPFLARFEGRQARSEEIVLLAQLSAIAAVVRLPFAAVPSVQPTSFVVIMTGLALGSERGFLVGALSALVSNLFLGQGPWTPWQMFAWGMMGAAFGLCRERLLRRRFLRLTAGFGAGLVFGWFMNLWYMASLGANLSWPMYITACLTSLPFDIAHGVGNVLCLLLLEKRFLGILQRVKRKYRI